MKLRGDVRPTRDENAIGHIDIGRREAIRNAKGGPVAEGTVGAGTGTMCYGWKGGIGTSSRKTNGGYTVGVLAQTNFGGNLTIGGAPIFKSLQPPRRNQEAAPLDPAVQARRQIGPRRLPR